MRVAKQDVRLPALSVGSAGGVAVVSVVVAIYLVAGVIAAVWSFRHGNHRVAVSTTAKVFAAIVAGLVWPVIALDLWLVDPDDTRRQHPER